MINQIVSVKMDFMKIPIMIVFNVLILVQNVLIKMLALIVILLHLGKIKQLVIAKMDIMMGGRVKDVFNVIINVVPVKLILIIARVVKFKKVDLKFLQHVVVLIVIY